MSKISRFEDGKDILTPTPVAPVVEVLEVALAKAKDGQIIGVAMVYLDRAQFLTTSFSGDAVTGAKMAGGISLLQHRYMKDWDPS